MPRLMAVSLNEPKSVTGPRPSPGGSAGARYALATSSPCAEK